MRLNNNKKNYQFILDFEVRDYECDLQGVVNNSVYLNYLEHTRHKFLQSIGIDFAEWTKNKINLVVTRAEIDYKNSLVSGDKFFVGLNYEKISALRFGFNQDIFLETDNEQKLVLAAKIIGTAIDSNGRPIKDKAILGKFF